MKKLIFIFCISIMSFQLKAQDTAKVSLDDMSLEQLLNIKVTVASGDEQNLNDAPGIVTVIYADQIRYSGARDLMDVLRMVPGLFFAQDVENVISMGVRGLWAQEGKILLLRDGIELHESSYSSLQFLQHYPLHQLDRIEIIRGAGSVVYGGNAGLCVINLISLKDKAHDGVTAGALYSRYERADGLKNGWLNIGKNFDGGFGFRISGHLMDGIFSDRIANVRIDSLSTRNIDLKDHSKTSTASLNAAFWYKDLELRYLFDDNRHDVIHAAYRFQHLTHAISIRKKFKIGEKFTLTPQIWQKQMYPWRYLNASDSLRFSNTFNKRTEANILGRFSYSANWSLLAGARWMDDRGEYYQSGTPFVFNVSQSREVRYTTWSVFLQSENRYKSFLLTSGLRYEKQNLFGAVLVPRINLTGNKGGWDFDLQYNEAFRAPVIFNLDVNPQLKPERTIDLELEIGRRFGEKMRASLVLYNVQVNNPIVYSFRDGVESYLNESRIQNYGVEAEWLYRDRKMELSASYSSYFASFDSPLYSVEEKPTAKIAMPNHKVGFSGRRFFGKYFFMSTQALFFSQIFGYDAMDELVQQRPMTLMSLTGGFRNIGDHWDISFTITDLLNEQFSYIQAYRSGNNPLPGAGRALNMKVIYRLPFRG